jgi:hypothetical protein
VPAARPKDTLPACAPALRPVSTSIPDRSPGPQAHLIEEHRADPDRTAAQNPATNPLKLLRQARERLGQGLRAVEAENIAESDEISLRNQ